MTQISLIAVLFVSMKSLILLFCILCCITNSSNPACWILIGMEMLHPLTWKRTGPHKVLYLYIYGTNLRKGKANLAINKIFLCGTEKYTDIGRNIFNSHIYTNSNETMLRTHTINSMPKIFQILSTQAWMEKPNHYIRNLPSPTSPVLSKQD